MGMLEAMKQNWRRRQDHVIELQTSMSERAGFFSGVTKTLRLTVQSVAIAAGAFLVLKQEISPGMLIAGSLLIGRALQPIELAVGSWKGFVAAKSQYQMLKLLFEQTDWRQDRMPCQSCADEFRVTKRLLLPGSQESYLARFFIRNSPRHCKHDYWPQWSGQKYFDQGNSWIMADFFWRYTHRWRRGGSLQPQ